MTEPDPLDERLAALGADPVPLAAPSAVRALGDRRRRHGRVALACAAVLAASTLGGGAALLSAGGGQDALRTATAPAPEPTPTPSCTLPAEALPPGEDEVVLYSGSYCSELTIEPDVPEPLGTVEPSVPPQVEPTAEPTTPTAPSAAPAAAWSPSSAFLAPEAATRAEGSAWQVDEGHGELVEPGPLVDPCGTGSYSDPPDAQAQRSLFAASEYGGGGLLQRVTRFGDSADAARALDAVVAAFERCPEQPADDEGLAYRYAVEQRSDGDARTAVVQVSHCREGSCEGLYRSYLLLAAAGDGLTEVHYGGGGDATPSEPTRPLLDAVALQLGRAVQG